MFLLGTTTPSNLTNQDDIYFLSFPILQNETVITALTGSMVLVFTTESDQVEALETIARNFVEGLTNQGI